MGFGFQIHELDDSPKCTVSRDRIQGTRRFLIPDANQLDFAIGMTAVPTGYGLAPAPFPRFSAARVESISFEPFSKKPDARTITDPVTQYNTFTGHATYGPCTCLATVTYLASIQNTQTSDPQEDGLPEGTWATYQQRFSGEFMTLPGRALTWDDGKPVGQDAHATLYIPLTDHVVTWNRVKSPPWNAISELKGQVNNASFRIPGCGQTREAETILFEGGEVGTEFKIDPTQPQFWNLTYTLKERRIVNLIESLSQIYGWNHLYDPVTTLWRKPRAAGSSPAKYLHFAGDLKRLFQFA